MLRYLILAIACLAAPIAAHAQHAGDIYIDLQKSQLTTGLIAGNQSVTPGVRTFLSTFGDSGFEGFTSNPGFDAAFVFDPAFRIGFNMLDALKVWNGSDLELTGGETLTISFLTLSRTSGECIVPGFDLAVQPDGGWHRHLSFVLNPDGQGRRDPGIYIAELELYHTKPGFQNSEPFWLIFNHNAPATDHAAARAWVEQNLVSPSCPEDLDGDNAVGVTELLAIINAWGSAPCNPADLTGDSVVGVADLLAVINAWGPCP